MYIKGYIKRMGENFLPLSRSKNMVWIYYCILLLYIFVAYIDLCRNYSLKYQETTKSAYNLH